MIGFNAKIDNDSSQTCTTQNDLRVFSASNGCNITAIIGDVERVFGVRILLNLKQSIGVIEGLLEEGSDASITYAALECRLTIERICYERLRVSHDYISTADIKRWQPHGVVNVLLQEVDKEIASTFTVSVSADVPKNPEPTKEDYEELSFSTLGTQVGFNANKLGKLWNALSKLALHVSVPTSKNDSIPLYGENDKSKAKVIEALTEIRRISKGTLVSAGMLSTGGNVAFTTR